MKQYITAIAVAAVLVAAKSAMGNATPIINGQTVSPVPAASVAAGATQLATETTKLVKTSTGTKFPAGTIQSWVYSGDANNPFAGGLTFVYQINISAASTTFADSFADSADWAGFLTDVGSKKTGVQINPASANRDSDILTWVFSPTHVTAGKSSALLIVETNAKKYQNDAFNVHDGGTSSADAYVPLAVPDGGLTVALLGGALIGLGAIRRKLS